MSRQPLRWMAGLTVLAMVLVACGQKPGVHVQGQDGLNQGGAAEQSASQDQGAGTGAAESASGQNRTPEDATGGGDTTGGTTTGAPDETTTTSRSQDTTTGGGSASTDGGASGTDGGGSASTDGGDTGGTDGGDTGGTDGGDTGGTNTQSGTRETQGTDRTGVGEDTITLGLHAPVTGAAPLPVTSFEESGDLYWRELDQQDIPVLGRSVDLIFRDDKYNPNSARQVCRELASKSFMVSGGGGTDQIQTCGQLAEVSEFPYSSAGVTEAGLRGNPWYYAFSMSYKQQGRLLAQFLQSRDEYRGKKTAAIVTNTPNFDDAVAGWEAGVEANGINYYKTLRHPKGDSSWYNSFANELNQNGVEVVYMLLAPVDYLRFAQQANESGYDFKYVGVGISMGLNAVLVSGCPDVADGTFFSPFPGIDWAQQNEPAFFEAAQERDAPADDIAFALWGISKHIHEIFNRYGQTFGNDLTREDFRAFAETQTGIDTGVFPPLNYSPDDHFGANQAHVLRANCETQKYETLETFRSSF